MFHFQIAPSAQIHKKIRCQTHGWIYGAGKGIIAAFSHFDISGEPYMTKQCNKKNQGLNEYVQEYEMIKTTKKLDNLMDWTLLNQNNFKRIQKRM